MTLPRHTPQGAPNRGLPPDRGEVGLTLRRFVILVISAAATAAVWRRTAGDLLLSVVTLPLICAALERWIRE
jgi:hypothetical protein